MIKSPDTEIILKNLKIFRDIPIINDLFLIMGAGKFGRIAFNYAIKHGYSTIIIIDENFNAVNDIQVEKIEDRKEFLQIYKKIIKQSFEKSVNQDQKTYFIQGGLDLLSLLFSFGIPELFIPVVPVHIMGKLVLNYLNVYFNGKKILKTHVENEYYSKIVKKIPLEVLLTAERSNGLITLSYAKIDEICPSNCIGEEEYCKFFKRNKPKTITKIIRNLSKTGKKGWVIESHQIQKGLGALYGVEIKKNITNILTMSNELRLFFVGTSCSCHGAINLFSSVI